TFSTPATLGTTRRPRCLARSATSRSRATGSPTRSRSTASTSSRSATRSSCRRRRPGTSTRSPGPTSCCPRRSRCSHPPRGTRRRRRPAHDHAHDLPPVVVHARAVGDPRRAEPLGRPRRGTSRRDHRDGGGLMYGWLWRHLPGPAVVRALILLVAAVAVVALLFEVVFPALAPLLP